MVSLVLQKQVDDPLQILKLTFKLKRRRRELESIGANWYNSKWQVLWWCTVIVDGLEDGANIVIG